MVSLAYRERDQVICSTLKRHPNCFRLLVSNFVKSVDVLLFVYWTRTEANLRQKYKAPHVIAQNNPNGRKTRCSRGSRGVIATPLIPSAALYQAGSIILGTKPYRLRHSCGLSRPASFRLSTWRLTWRSKRAN
jgi:hypothetical protein